LAADPTNVRLLQQQAAHDRAALAFAARLRRRGTITNAQYVQYVQGYQSDLLSTLDTIASQTKQTADATKKANQRLKIPGDVSGSFMYGHQFEIPLRLQIAQARAAALGNESGIRSIARQIKEAAQRALKSGKLAAQAQIDAWNAIADANQTLGEQTKAATTKFQHLDPHRIAAMLGLGASRYAETIIAMIGRGGTFPGGTAAFATAGGGVHIHGDVHLHGVQDVPAFENEMIKQGRGQPHTRRGSR
jgi:hypothetical protein